jgi:hypothetical protein
VDWGGFQMTEPNKEKEGRKYETSNEPQAQNTKPLFLPSQSLMNHKIRWVLNPRWVLNQRWVLNRRLGLLGKIVMAAMSGLVFVDGAFGRWDLVISRSEAMVGCSWLRKEPWQRLNA